MSFFQTKWQEQLFWEEIICTTLRNITDLKRDITIYQLIFLQLFQEQKSEISSLLDNAKSSQRQFYSMSSELRKKESKETLEKLSACSEPLTSISTKKECFFDQNIYFMTTKSLSKGQFSMIKYSIEFWNIRIKSFLNKNLAISSVTMIEAIIFVWKISFMYISQKNTRILLTHQPFMSNANKINFIYYFLI